MDNEAVGLFSGSITYRRFRVEGELPDNYRELFLQAVRDRVHREIDVESDDERAIGWVCAAELLDTDITLEKLFVGDTLVLTLRVDTLKVPSSALALYSKAAEREFMKATGKERLSKRDREEIRDRVVISLRKRQLPSVKGFDFAWSISEGVLRLWTHNKNLTDDFLGLFHDTFGMRAVPRTPYTALLELGLPDDVAERALRVEPADFSVPAAELERM